MQSWGYLVQRASRISLNLTNLLSRVPKLENHEARQMPSSQGAIAEYSELRIQGRIVLNLWRLLRQEVSEGCSKNVGLLKKSTEFLKIVLCPIKGAQPKIESLKIFVNLDFGF